MLSYLWIDTNGTLMEDVEVIELEQHEFLQGLHLALQETNKKLSNQQIAQTAHQLYGAVIEASVMEGLQKLYDYQDIGRQWASQGEFHKLENEKHCPKRLSEHMRLIGKPRPVKMSAHAIVSGRHKKAKMAREILADFGIRIDDPDNGVFLPVKTAYTPHEDMPNAHPHSRVHTERYYINVTNRLSQVTSERQARAVLRRIAQELQNGTMRIRPQVKV